MRYAGLLTYPLILFAVWAAAMALNYAASTLDPETLRLRAAAMLVSDPRPHVLRQHENAFETCQTTSAALASTQYASETALLSRLLLHRLHSSGPRGGIAGSASNYCPELMAATGPGFDYHPAWLRSPSDDVPERVNAAYFKIRYAVQQVSVYGLLLSALPYHVVGTVLVVSTVVAVILLMWSVSRLGGRMLLSAAPVCVAAGAWSAVPLWNDAGNGITFFAAAIFLAGTALAVRLRGAGWGAPCCFATGAALQLFWFMDSHQTLVLTLVALLGYFALDPERPLRRALLWSGAYLAGSGASFAIGMLARAATLQLHTDMKMLDRIINSFTTRYERYVGLAERNSWQDRVLPFDEMERWASILSHGPVELAALTLLFGTVAVFFGYTCLRHRMPSVRAGDLWPLLVLSLLCLVQFIAPEDVPNRAARYVCVPVGLALGMAALTLARRWDRWDWWRYWARRRPGQRRQPGEGLTAASSRSEVEDDACQP